MELTVSDREGETVVHAAGELDVNTAPELREQLARLIAEDVRRIVVDLTDVSFVDSTALSVLVSALKRLRQADGDLQLATPNPSVRRVFEITGLTRLFTIR
ncbi:MAG: STAS domain-containing protein [Acidimicrobiia bacterium]|nr:STAS domain-containing protein [Acidimicrobiia bacterium]